MGYNFVRFEGNTKRQDDFLSLTKTYSIGLSKIFLTKNDIVQKYVVLYFDPKKLAIALHFTSNKNSRGAYGVIYDKRKVGGSISCVAFIKANGIDLEKYSGKYTYKKEGHPEIGEIFVVDLKEKVNESI